MMWKHFKDEEVNFVEAESSIEQVPDSIFINITRVWWCFDPEVFLPQGVC
jgi:hypothetical protein